MTVFQGPAFTDATGGTSGTNLAGVLLNTLVVAQQSYLQSGGIASSASSANPPVVTQPAAVYVINSGTGVSWHSLTATNITLGAGSSAQDNYIDVDDTGTYSVHTGSVGFTPPAVAANALRLYKATTNSSNNGVSSFTALAATSPISSVTAMNINGTNAGAVAFPSTLSVAGTTSLAGLTTSGNGSIGGTLGVTGNTTLSGTLTVAGLATLNGGLGTSSATLSANLSVAGTAAFTGAAGFNGTTSPTAPISVWGTVSTTANYGAVSVGPGPWDGNTSGKFVGLSGSNKGTLYAANAGVGFTGGLIDLQVQGVSIFRVDGYGHTINGGPTPGIAPGNAVGTGGSATLQSGATDKRGQVNYTAGTGGIVNNTICTITFANPYPSTPAVSVTGCVTGGNLFLPAITFVSQTGFVLQVNGVPSPGESGVFWYIVEG